MGTGESWKRSTAVGDNNKENMIYSEPEVRKPWPGATCGLSAVRKWPARP